MSLFVSANICPSQSPSLDSLNQHWLYSKVKINPLSWIRVFLNISIKSWSNFKIRDSFEIYVPDFEILPRFDGDIEENPDSTEWIDFYITVE